VVDQGRIGESHWAAQAAECANQQGKFWEYHDKLFQLWTGENVGTFAKAKLKQYASDIVPDTAIFNQCLDSDKTASVIDADVAEATRLGVQGTPTFFVNNRLLNVSTIDYGQFSRTFDSLMK
jgi:protein-disulfide isomerase